MVVPGEGQMARKRVDQLLVEQGNAASVDEARRLILAGRVHGENRRYEKPGELIRPGTTLSLKPDQRKYVSRGGEKLEGALEDFGIDPSGKRCLDLGASTGGFTHCLLEQGATHVVAVDSGTNQLALLLREDDRVTCREKTRFRDLAPVDFPRRPDVVVADLSFVSLRQAVPMISEIMAPEGDALLLVKPQFELPPALVPPGGVVTRPEDRRRAVELVMETARSNGLATRGVSPARIRGANGNQEYFVHLSSEEGTEETRIALDAIFA